MCLGRTGSLIGCYLIKHYRMTAHEAIAWMRICRPGSVIAQQQGWLEELEPWLIKQGNLYRRRNNHDVDILPTHEFGIYSIVEKTRKHRPKIFSKSQSPPPPIQRQGRSDISPPARPQASKVREASCKTIDKPEFGRKEKMSAIQKILIKGIKPTEKVQLFGWKENMSTEQKNLIKGKPRDSSAAVTSRRGCGSGEPRVLRPLSRTNSVKQHGNSNEPNDRNLNGYFHVPIFHTSQTPVAKTLEDAKNILMQSTLHNDQRATLYHDQRKNLYFNKRTTVSNDQRARKLDSAIIVKPQYTFRGGTTNAFNERPIPGNATKLLSSTFSTVPKSSTQPQQRRRLGRSPSPPVIKMVNEQSRATNTPPPVEIFKKRVSKTNLMEELSSLKSTAPRHGSIGAASLGARRDAPPDRRAPSVRSDERPLATQGDMLNSIKFQRRFRETINAERSGKFNNIPSTTSKDKPTIRNISSRTSSAGPKAHIQEHRCNNPTQEKTGTDTRFSRAPRPSSPKGRRSPNTFY
ncbi:uncharacterized protein [Maniola hyperantus]|uniref:uncharacterized protein n=1 Tax=Aphantopus hyperantus TaxID=2795564 RepID=UPI003749C8B4